MAWGCAKPTWNSVRKRYWALAGACDRRFILRSVPHGEQFGCSRGGGCGVTTWEHPGYSQLRMLFRALHGPAREGGGEEEPSAAAFREQLQRALRREEPGAA